MGLGELAMQLMFAISHHVAPKGKQMVTYSALGSYIYLLLSHSSTK